MKIKQKFIISIILILFIFISSKFNKVNAALQANGETSKVDTIANWLLNIRKMESEGETLGLDDTINETNLTSSAENSNNLDIHMEKNTEYGAMAILSASAYGKQNKIENGETTTGNETGVYIFLNKEWVSGGAIQSLKEYVNANAKYKSYYAPGNYIEKPGDAITSTAGWHGSTSSVWPEDSWMGNSSGQYDGLLRAHGGSIFSYYRKGYAGYSKYNAYYTNKWSTRAVVVVGEGY